MPLHGREREIWTRSRPRAWHPDALHGEPTFDASPASPWNRNTYQNSAGVCVILTGVWVHLESRAMWSKLWCALASAADPASCATSSAVEQDLSLLRRQVAALSAVCANFDTRFAASTIKSRCLAPESGLMLVSTTRRRSESLGQHEAPPPRHRDRARARRDSLVGEPEPAMSPIRGPRRGSPRGSFPPHRWWCRMMMSPAALSPSTGQPPILTFGPRRTTNASRSTETCCEPSDPVDAGAVGRARARRVSARADGPRGCRLRMASSTLRT